MNLFLLRWENLRFPWDCPVYIDVGTGTWHKLVKRRKTSNT